MGSTETPEYTFDAFQVLIDTGGKSDRLSLKGIHPHRSPVGECTTNFDEYVVLACQKRLSSANTRGIITALLCATHLCFLKTVFAASPAESRVQVEVWVAGSQQLTVLNVDDDSTLSHMFSHPCESTESIHDKLRGVEMDSSLTEDKAKANTLPVVVTSNQLGLQYSRTATDGT